MPIKSSKKTAYQSLEKKLTINHENIWISFPAKIKNEIFSFADGYMQFLDVCRTERLCVQWAKKMLEKNNFKDLDTIKQKSAKPGQAFYYIFRNKVIVAGKIGKAGVDNGMNLVLSHIDAPRVDLKPYPLYEDERMALLKTHYYGGIKKYQWTSIPLALHGIAITKSGKSVEIHIGDKPTDPIFTITDILPHLAKQQMARKTKDAILGEEMNVLVGSIPVDDKKVKKAVKLTVLECLYKTYGIDEEDFIAMEVAIVPAFPVRDIGLDRGMIGGYGQDDRICSFAGLQALLNAKPTTKTQLAIWIDREEIGSTGDTGADSDFIRFLFGKIAQAVKGDISEETLKGIFYQSEAISGDVTGGLDSTHKSIADVNNAPRINEGIVICRYSGYGGKFSTSEASAEFTAKIMRIFRGNKIPWQSGELGKVDEGGGGTIAKFISNYGIKIIDCGPPILNMHSPYEVASKADLYATYLGYKAFFENA